MARTGKHLTARGYKLVSLPRRYDARHTSYKVVAVDADDRRGDAWAPGARWLGVIEPVVETREWRFGDGTLYATCAVRQGFAPFQPLRRGPGFRKRPLGQYATAVEAAHALLDAAGIE